MRYDMEWDGRADLDIGNIAPEFRLEFTDFFDAHELASTIFQDSYEGQDVDAYSYALLKDRGDKLADMALTYYADHVAVRFSLEVEDEKAYIRKFCSSEFATPKKGFDLDLWRYGNALRIDILWEGKFTAPDIEEIEEIFIASKGLQSVKPVGEIKASPTYFSDLQIFSHLREDQIRPALLLSWALRELIKNIVRRFSILEKPCAADVFKRFVGDDGLCMFPPSVTHERLRTGVPLLGAIIDAFMLMFPKFWAGELQSNLSLKITKSTDDPDTKVVKIASIYQQVKDTFFGLEK